MAETLPPPAPGDPCPNCGGAFKQAYQPTEEERAAALNRDNPIPLRTGADTATAAQVKELGELYTCRECGYQTRVKPSDGARRDARPAERQADRPADRPAAETARDRAPAERQAAAAPGGAADDAHTQRIAELERQLAEARGQGPRA